MRDSFRAVTFDLDAESTADLRAALPGWEVEAMAGATAASLARGWDPAAADLLVVQVVGQGADAIGLCRFLTVGGDADADTRASAVPRAEEHPTVRANAPVLVLMPPRHEPLVREALAAGAHSCLMLPINPKDVASMLAHARAGNRPGRHTSSLEGAQKEDAWRDEGGEG